MLININIITGFYERSYGHKQTSNPALIAGRAEKIEKKKTVYLPVPYEPQLPERYTQRSGGNKRTEDQHY